MVQCSVDTEISDVADGWLLQKIQADSPFPLTVQLALTERCNLACRHCYVCPRDSEEEQLSLPEYEALFRELAACGVLVLAFSGGEPGLRKDLESIMEAAGRHHFVLKMKSNGILLTSKRLKTLFDAGLSILEVSLYDIDASGHDEFVGTRGAWHLSTNAMHEFSSLGGRVKANISLMSWNAARVPAILDFCEEHNYDYAIDPIIVPKEDGSFKPTDLRADEQRLKIAMTDKRILDADALVQEEERSRERPICGAGRTIASVNSRGDVFLCERLADTLGNLRTKSFGELWQNSEILKRFLAVRWKDLGKCSNCGFAWACSHCPGLAFLECRDTLSYSPYECVVARVRADVCNELVQPKRSP